MTAMGICHAGLATVALVLAGCGATGPRTPPARAASEHCDVVASLDGDDRASGTVADPLRTPQRVIARLRAGQVGCLRAGTYVQDVTILRSHIALQSYDRERAKIVGRMWVHRRADDVVIRGLVLDGRNVRRLPSPTVNGDHVTFSDNVVTNGQTGICFDLGGAPGYGIAQHTLLLRNRIHDCGARPADNRQHGIYVERAIDTRIIDNVIYDNADRGIQLYPDAQHTVITGNVIDGNGEGIIFSGDGSTSSSYATVEHNLLTGSRVRANLESWWPTAARGVGNHARRNCLWGGRPLIDRSQGGFDTAGDTVADPGYRAARLGDFRIDPKSPCAALLATSAAPAGPGGEPPVSGP